MTTKNNNLESSEKAVLSDALVLPLRVIDLDSPFFFGVGRDMTDEERTNAERHGRYDNPPMSVLGVTSEGLAAVEGKDLAQVFAAAPELLEALEHIMRYDRAGLGSIGDGLALAAIAKASGQNVKCPPTGATDKEVES